MVLTVQRPVEIPQVHMVLIVQRFVDIALFQILARLCNDSLLLFHGPRLCRDPWRIPRGESTGSDLVQSC